jgi:hypothetical protein
MRRRFRHEKRTAGGWPGFLAALAWLSLALNLPNWPPYWFGAGHARLAPEAVALLVVLALAGLLRRQPGRAGVWAIAVPLFLLMLLRLGDLAANLTLGRPVSLALDLPLLPSILEVIIASASWTGLAAGAVLVPAGLAAVLVLNRAAVGVLAGTAGRRSLAVLAGALAVLAAGAAGLGPFPPPSWSVTALAANQIRGAVETAALREDYRRRLEADPLAADAGTAGLLAGLEGRDVTIVFVESYGAAALDDPGLSPAILPLLDRAGRRLAAAGISLRSGRLESPVRGGQSWLAHGTLLTGLPLSSQPLYAVALSAGRTTLAHLFARAGYATAAVVPAVRRAWPEGAVLGFERIVDADGLGYAGPAYGWGGIPDQYTLSVLDRVLPAGRPVFAQVVLVSSHGPWHPVPPLVADWDAVGKSEVYLTAERHPGGADMRADYVAALGYSLASVFDWIERRVENGGLVIVLGDHQPAPLVAGPDASFAVPVHVASRSAGLVEAFADWGFAPGPRPGGEPLPMAAFRDRFVEAFSRPRD